MYGTMVSITLPDILKTIEKIGFLQLYPDSLKFKN